MKKAKEDWIGAQCEEIETCLNKNNSKRANQLVKDLTSEKQGRSSTIQDKSGKCLTEEKEILSRWTEYCSELYNYESCGDNAVLDCCVKSTSNTSRICTMSSFISKKPLTEYGTQPYGPPCGSTISVQI